MTTVLGTGGNGASRATDDRSRATVPPVDQRRGVLSPVTSLIERVRSTVGVLYREMLKFGVVGAVAFVVDIGVFNLVSSDLWPGTGVPPLDGHEKIAKAVSVTLATLVAWVGNRLWSFRHRRQTAAHRELALFVIMNVAGLLIAVTCLTISHDLLGFTSTLADNVSGNLIGIALGTLFRFWAYRRFVFTELRDPASHALDEADDMPAAGLAATSVPAADPITADPIVADPIVADPITAPTSPAA